MLFAKGPLPADLVGTKDSTALQTLPGMSLSRRLILIFFSAALLLVVTASAILYWATLNALRSADDQVVDKRASVIIEILRSDDLNEGLLAHEINEDNQGPRQIFMRVVSAYEPIVIETEGMEKLIQASEFPDAASSPPLEPVRKTLTTADGKTYRGASVKVDFKAKGAPITAFLQVATDTTLDDAGLAVFRRILVAVLGAAIPVCAFFAWVVVRRGLKPLDRITAATRTIDGSSLDQRLRQTDLPAELHDLAVQFNSMLARLEKTWLDLRHYADTIAHELRTPLNRMRLDCELALDGAKSEAEIRDVLAGSAVECERLTRLLQGLLFLSRADSKQASIAPSDLALDREIATIAEYFGTEAAEAGVTLDVRCPPGITVRADRILLQQAVSNLVSNAIDHTPPGGLIALETGRTGSEALISVQDNGDGIPPEHHDRLFDRFYRASSDDRATKVGQRLGLGLSIVKSVVDLHGGRIAIDSAPGRGTRVTLALPAVN